MCHHFNGYSQSGMEGVIKMETGFPRLVNADRLSAFQKRVVRNDGLIETGTDGIMCLPCNSLRFSCLQGNTFVHLDCPALVIVQPTQCGVRRLVAAFRAMRRQVAALHKLTHRAER